MEKPMKKFPIKYKKERTVLSDVLPYEIPVIYSNRYFYNFLIKNQIEINSKDFSISWIEKESRAEFYEIIKLLFGVKSIENNHGKIFNEEREKNYALKRIPFIFKIAHKNGDYRELSIIHPLNQLPILSLK